MIMRREGSSFRSKTDRREGETYGESKEKWRSIEVENPTRRVSLVRHVDHMCRTNREKYYRKWGNVFLHPRSSRDLFFIFC